ncbi:VOC family protein [Altererythrobacter lutimaris]|uniref:VOC family protein n=1 Tax=Altererythrobacter lutimaris TaxID=2743979 RepID=A0A850HH63_9SPHN|nr:VOC family protein [Altererythrobacter lutimaris]NVE94342.1 VOC family protein [Altererythrobacter lutimaris]
MAGVLSLSACGPQTSELPEDSVIKGVGWVGAVVSDLDQTTKLYEDAIDLKQADDGAITQSSAFDQLAGRDGVEVQTRMMRSANMQIRFMSFANPSSAAQATPQMEVVGPGIMHVCYQVDQETQTYQKFLAGGATFMGKKEMQQLTTRNPVYYSYSRDFDGLIAEIEHVDVAALDLPSPPKNDRRIRHVALATPDVDRLAEFYAVLLGQPEFRRLGNWPFMRMEGEKFDAVAGLEGGVGESAWFQIRNLELEIFQFHSHPTQVPEKPRPLDALGYNMIVLDVSDLDAARALFEEAGGTIVVERAPLDGGEIIFGRDPDGNLIGLQAAPTDSFVSSRNFKNNGIE